MSAARVAVLPAVRSRFLSPLTVYGTFTIHRLL